MRRCFLFLIMLTIAWTQEAPPGLTVPPGVPLRVALDRRVVIKRVGAPLQGRLVEPVFTFDRIAIPAGSLLEGHVAEIGGVSTRRRLRSLLSGNFTPPREVRGQFDTLILSNGTRLPLRTVSAHGSAHTARVVSPRKTGENGTHPGSGSKGIHAAALRAFQAPGKLDQVKSAVLGMLPYQRQVWSTGTLFSSVLQQPLVGLPASSAPKPANGTPPAEQEIHARLLQPLTSRTARRGDLVEAAVTEPLFSSEGKLLIPEGSRLQGEVLDARPSRRFHRNGKLLFVFRQIRPAGGAPQNIQGYLEGVDADFRSHVALDSEGAVRVDSPKSRFIFPAIAGAVAGLSLHQDYNAQGVPDQDIVGRAESGAVGLGLIGTVLAQTSRTVASGIAFTGAAFSVYTTFIGRGDDLYLPAQTPVRISVKARPGGNVR